MLYQTAERSFTVVVTIVLLTFYYFIFFTFNILTLLFSIVDHYTNICNKV